MKRGLRGISLLVRCSISFSAEVLPGPTGVSRAGQPGEGWPGRWTAGDRSRREHLESLRALRLAMVEGVVSRAGVLSVGAVEKAEGAGYGPSSRRDQVGVRQQFAGAVLNHVEGTALGDRLEIVHAQTSWRDETRATF